MAGERISADELFGQNEALIESIGRDAYRYGQSIGKRKRAELEPHVDLFHDGERGLDVIASRFALEAQDCFKQETDRGANNTLYMNDAGFIALLAMTAESTQGRRFRSVFEVDQPELDYPEVVDVLHPSMDDTSLLGVKFPRGKVELKLGREQGFTSSTASSFDMWQSSDLFHERVSELFPYSRNGRLQLGLHEVVRIETTDGELWQNPHFSPEGLLLPKEPVDILGRRG